jgi:Calcineurin-like phosphoesterase
MQKTAVLAIATFVATCLAAPLAQPAFAITPIVSANPTQLAPSVHLAPLGTLTAKAVPLQVSWPAATAGGSPIASYELQVSRDNGPWTSVALPRPLARSVITNRTAWGVLDFRVRAVDQDSNASDWANSDPVWMQIAQESDPAVVLSAGWQIVSSTSAFGGRHAVTTSSGETAAITFTGREVGWIGRLGPNQGAVQVEPDGRDPALINLHRNSASSRRIVFEAVYPTTDAHSLTLTTETIGAQTDVDAFVVLSDPSDTTLVGAGDIASCTGGADSATAALAAAVPGIVFTAGDNVYPNGTAANFTNCYDPSWGALKARTMPVIGNHEYENVPGATGYFGYFGAAAGIPPTGWYKYDAGTWRIYALSSECKPTTCPQQLAWLKASLAAEPHLCTLAIWHRPRFSTGPHGNAARMDAIWKLLAANGADVVINGHDHMYERYTPLDGNGAADANGIREFVVGTGGASLYAFKTDSALVDVRENTSHGVLRLDLGEGTYSWQFLPSDGPFTDSGTGTCH